MGLHFNTTDELMTALAALKRIVDLQPSYPSQNREELDRFFEGRAAGRYDASIIAAEALSAIGMK